MRIKWDWPLSELSLSVVENDQSPPVPYLSLSELDL